MPHSAISGSPRVCHSPELLAAYHGLHRLCVPRHPPHAFLRLTTIDVSKQNYAHCFKRVTFSCENVISIKDSINPTIYHVHPLSNSTDPHFSEENGVNNREWMDRMCRDEATTRCFPPAAGCRGYSRSVKEVIQPQVPLRLPCYDFAPVTALAFGRLVPCGFRHGLRALTASMA